MTVHHKLNELCNIQSGGTPRRGKDGYYGGNIPWAKIGDIENAVNGYITETEENITKEGLKSINNRLFPEKTVLLAMYGSVGKTAIAGREISTNQAILGLQPKNKDILDFRFLKYYLDFSKRSLVNKARGVALQNISATIVKDFIIPLPSLPIQNEIIKILDQADSIRSKRKQATSLLDEYIKSVFIEMFGDPVSNSKNWEKVELKFFGEIITGNTPSRNENDNYSSEFIEWIKTDNIVEDNLYLTKASEHLSETGLNKARFVTSGAVLMACIAGSIASIGRVAIADRKVSFNQQINAIQPNEKINSLFLYWLLRNSRTYVQDHATRGMKRILTKGEFEKIKMIIPPIELQDKFAMIARDTEVLKQKMLEQSRELDNQFQSLMQNSFKKNNYEN